MRNIQIINRQFGSDKINPTPSPNPNPTPEQSYYGKFNLESSNNK